MCLVRLYLSWLMGCVAWDSWSSRNSAGWDGCEGSGRMEGLVHGRRATGPRVMLWDDQVFATLARRRPVTTTRGRVRVG